MKEENLIGFIYHPDYLKHDAGEWHPERPERLKTIVESLKSSNYWDELIHIDPVPATVEQVTYVHTDTYVEAVRKFCQRGGGSLDQDTGVSRESFDVALLSAGGAIRAAKAVMDGEVQSAFAAIRPPGHHAFPGRAKGFCIFNNIAICARYLQKEHDLEKILIVDWDLHHGDGTCYYFYDDPSVFYFSIHQHPFYPGTGRAYETGSGKGIGYTLNVPVPYGTTSEEYVEIFREKLMPVAMRFIPDFVLISAGFDAHKADPLSGIELTSESYGLFTNVVKEIADYSCDGKIVSLLEGGYEPVALSESVLEHLKHLKLKENDG
ncbi:histone deacetylase [Candidatus Poribacteria bacterium]|nr:histone deacetylase [Candidatus Poribacteria bacterium]